MKFFTDNSLQSKVLELIKSTVDVITVEQFIAVPVIQKVFKGNELGYVVVGSSNKDDFVFTVKQIKYDTDEVITLGSIHINKSDIDSLKKLGFRDKYDFEFKFLTSDTTTQSENYRAVVVYANREATTIFDKFDKALAHLKNRLEEDTQVVECRLEESRIKKVGILKRK